MYLQGVVKRARVPLRKQGDGWVELPFPADFGPAGAGFRPPAPRRTYSHNFCDRTLVPIWKPSFLDGSDQRSAFSNR
jgi:hypothetical protein